MECTGHTSLGGVRKYKRTCSDQQKMLSNLISANPPSKVSKIDHSVSPTVNDFTPLKNVPNTFNLSGCNVQFNFGSNQPN